MGFESELAGGLARTLSGVPDRHIQQAMRTPLRRPVLEALFWGLPRVLADTRADEITTHVRCHVTGRSDGQFDVYSIEYTDGRWQTARGGASGATGTEPELTVTIDAAELVLIALQKSSPLQAYLSGRLRASGNPIIAARLTMFIRGFGAPDRRTQDDDPGPT